MIKQKTNQMKNNLNLNAEARSQSDKGGKMKNNLILVTLAFAMFAILSMSMASAAIAYVTPTASAYVPSGLFYVNVTYVNATDITDPTSFGSGNSSIFFNDIMFSTYNGNRNCSATACWAQINSADTGIPEGTYLLKVSLGNTTNKWYANQTQTITIDRTNPSLDAKETTVSQYEPINYKCSDTNINTFTVSHPNAAGTTVTDTLQKSTSDYVQIVTTGVGTYTFTCTDLAGNSATDSVTVSAPVGYANPSAKAIPAGENFFNKEVFKFGTFSMPMWLLLAIAAIGLVYFMQKK